VPLLIESGLTSLYSLVIVVMASTQRRVERLVRDRGFTEEQALARIRAQATDEQRRAAADVIVDNDGSAEELRRRVDQVWRDRLRPAARGDSSATE